MIEHVPKVYKGRAESNGINSEDAQKREFNGEHLICSRDFNWNSHCELFVLILRRLLILFDEEPAAGLKNVSHNVKRMFWNGNDLMGEVEILTTPSGNILKELLKKVEMAYKVWVIVKLRQIDP